MEVVVELITVSQNFGITAKITPDQRKLTEIQKQIITTILQEQKIPEVTDQIIEIVKLSALLSSDKKPAKVLSNNNGVQAPNLPKECEV
ncbi:hypothetical protein CDL12_11352 [Handroanthus impetiginosus]|uniref:Uncharacterized protein n=1 Tax=Handroanthus impetiginosus TaxID=429701 RepID=A0A2G9HEN1_9LAMI|nr:hypothetical protein CDL12_11352 [Handroanthus impetiginosus]